MPTKTDPPAPHRFPLRVYYEDTDFSGVVYHANYLKFLERGRTEMLRDLGVDQVAMFEDATPSFFAVVEQRIAFRKPARMDDRLVVESAVASVGRASVRLEQQVLRGTEVLVVAEVKVALLGGGRPIRIPGPLLTLLWPARGRAIDNGVAPGG